MTDVINYRSGIIAIAERYSGAGDDWERALLDGAPEMIDAKEAISIAEWLETEAPVEWDERKEKLYDEIAAEIRALVAQ